MDDFEKFKQIASYSGADLETITIILDNELRDNYGLFIGKADAEKFAIEIIDWWSLNNKIYEV